ncbi:MAG: ferrous iron transport protein B [Clostridia bacterium]|nr:ferrous iron transport protein B [Clostridia bacterium]
MLNDNLVLVGNPNVGKTTFFNLITKSFEHTGNWHGVTTDITQKQINIGSQKVNVVDLPGIYSLSSYSFEEQVSVEYLIKNKNLNILNICDANVLQRNLYLTLQLKEMGLNPNLYINFYNEIKSKGREFDFKKLSEELDVNIYVSEKNKNKEKGNILKIINNQNNKTYKILPYLKFLPINEVLSVLNYQQKMLFNLPETFIAIKILEQDSFITENLNLSESQKNNLNSILNKEDYLQKISDLRYDYISFLIKNSLVKNKNFVYGKFKIDKIILNKYLCFPIFLSILFLIFYITFSSVGSYFSSLLKNFLDNVLGNPIKNFLIKINSPAWIIGLFSVGIIESVGGLFSFIPQIVLLFLFLSILEDSGYMSRLAFCFEDILYSIGLSGKSIFTIIMSFGCTTSAILTARNIEDRNARIKTAIISPYMSCSAKLPIFAVIGGAFFSKGNIFIIISLYLLGVIIAILVSMILNKFIIKSGERSFILEFPPYRKPSVKRVAFLIWQNCKQFVVKVGTILLSFSVIVWILQNFTFDFQYVPNTLNQKSILQVVGESLSILFKPIGLDNWGIVASLIVGIMAKEMVVSTMAIINKIPATDNFESQLGLSLITNSFAISLSPLTAVIMLIFSLLYMPCISTIAVLKKEIGFKYTLLSCVLQFSIAYFICFIIYNICVGSMLLKVLSICLVVVLIVFAVYFSFFKKDKCKNCNCFQSCKNKGFKC